MTPSVHPRDAVTAEAPGAVWIETRLDAASGVPRLGSEQPERGLVWVTRGRLSIGRPGGGRPGGESVTLAQGSVVAYRLGDGLAWSAGAGTRVRWCAREVDVRAGEIEPWTSEIAVGEEDVVAAPRRRPWMSLAALALLWISAGSVAWCVGTAQSRTSRLVDSLTSRSPASAEAKQASADLKAHVVAVLHPFGVSDAQVSIYAKRRAASVFLPIADAAVVERLGDANGLVAQAAAALAPLLVPGTGLEEVRLNACHPDAPGTAQAEVQAWDDARYVIAAGGAFRKEGPPGGPKPAAGGRVDRPAAATQR